VTSKRATIAYNALGQRTTLARFQSTGTTNAVATTDYTYDTINRLSSLTHKHGSTTLAGYTYSYDALSRPTSINSVLDGVSTFTYDATSQLTAADHSSQVDESYGFDANGNRNTSGYTTATNNRTTAAPGFTFTYDDEGNRTSKTETATGKVTEYTWDYRNRLTTVRDRNTSGGAVVKQVDYQYDAFNRLVRRTFDADGAGAGSVTNQYWVYDGGINAVLQFDGSAASNLSHRYLWSDNVDELIANEQIGSDTLYGLGDHLGTIRDIANFNEGTGVTSVTNHRKYDSFGKLISESNSAVDLIFGFTGKQLDEATGLQHNLFRWYDSALGQWLSEDPIGFAAGDENIRRYVGNHASFITDSSGLDWHHILLKQWLFDHGYIDENGDTTSLVTGGKLNVHSKENGLEVEPADHNRRPNSMHCKDSDGGSEGMTIDKHFEDEMKKRIDPITRKISIEDLNAAGQATLAKYPDQVARSRPADDDYPNRRPLRSSSTQSQNPRNSTPRGPSRRGAARTEAIMAVLAATGATRIIKDTPLESIMERIIDRGIYQAAINDESYSKMLELDRKVSPDNPDYNMGDGASLSGRVFKAHP